MAGDKDTLLGMGFDAARVEWALKATGNRGLQPAMDHILEHEGQPVPDLGGVTETKGGTSSNEAMDVDDDEDAEALKSLGAVAGNAVEAKSIKCSECGKIFKNTALANFHAEKSGHDQFEESTEEVKPLTEEEKKQKLAELREKMAEKRAKKAQEEAKEHKASEAIRRKAGKDINKIKEDMKLKEALKEAEAKKREKIADAKAKAAVKAQIEADKKARAEKAAREKALRDGQPLPGSADSTPSTSAARPAAAAVASVAGRDFKETRLQIRMASGGQPYTTTLPSDEPLRSVAEYLAGQTLSVDVDNVTLSQHFPRKTFSREDFSKSLKDLGLTPSAVLIANVP
ncbi:ubiquitin-related domain-containing protein [Crucibulum laeve]|uniref:Ubiquitin-related domain-containing protein n=1 Tax=Crucibulum laeve TaxID=68775 RepID=A0A5C3M4T0_9AGAR|nr:ubiquitin-related domain-containing protein [Crucibulum laeve]